jgi:hypothetical protein
MAVWLTVLGIILLLLTALALFGGKIEGFSAFKDEQMAYGDIQNAYFGKKVDGLFTSPGVNVAGLNEAAASPDLLLPASDKVDYASKFSVDPYYAFREEDIKKCRAATHPRDLPARAAGDKLGCGWYFKSDPGSASVGALGTRTGPIIDDDLAGGEWIWDLAEAARREDLKVCKRVNMCELVDAEGIKGKCGFCKEKGHAVPVNGAGEPKYPDDSVGGCGNVVTRAADCAPPPDELTAEGVQLEESPSTGAVEGRTRFLCAPDESGALSRDCVLTILRAFGYADSGALVRAVTNGVMRDTNDTVALSTLRSVGTNIPDVIWTSRRIDFNGLIFAIWRLSQIVRNGPSEEVKAAARHMVSGDGYFQPCDIKNDTKGPFNVQCLQQAFRKAGCQAGGQKYPSQRAAVSDLANMSWAQVNNLFRQQFEATKSSDPTAQDAALKDCLGPGTQFYRAPKADCYRKTASGYDEGSGAGQTCFDNLTADEAKERCSANPNCKSFSFSKGVDRGRGCFKMDKVGFNPRSDYEGYTKLKEGEKSFAPNNNMIMSKVRNNFSLDINGWSRDDFGRVIVWDGHGGTNQRFTLDNKNRLVNTNSGKCLDVLNNDTRPGAPVIQYRCHDGANQQWDGDEKGRIRPRSAPDKCLDVWGGSGANGTGVVIWPCHDGVMQKWEVK